MNAKIIKLSHPSDTELAGRLNSTPPRDKNILTLLAAHRKPELSQFAEGVFAVDLFVSPN